MRDPLAGADLLLEAHKLITEDRQGSYGHPVEDYRKVIQIFEALTGRRLGLSDAILFMVSVKLARLRTNLHSGRLHQDSLIDAVGYLGCLAMVDAALRPPAAEDRNTPRTPA